MKFLSYIVSGLIVLDVEADLTGLNQNGLSGLKTFSATIDSPKER